MENSISKNWFYVCTVVMFCAKDGDLYYKDLDIQEIDRLIIFADGKFFDVESGDEILTIEEDNGVITGEIYANTMYVGELYNIEGELSEEQFNRGQEVYKNYLLRKKLIEEKKLVNFKQKRLY